MINENENSPEQNVLEQRKQRTSRLVKLQLFNDRIGMIDAMLRNITESGAGIKTEYQLMTREHVVFTIRNHPPVEATVRWYKFGKAGLLFAQPFDIEVLSFNKMHEAEGIYRDRHGYHVFDRFQSKNDFKRPGFKTISNR